LQVTLGHQLVVEAVFEYDHGNGYEQAHDEGGHVVLHRVHHGGGHAGVVHGLVVGSDRRAGNADLGLFLHQEINHALVGLEALLDVAEYPFLDGTPGAAGLLRWQSGR
jgi:hypothetical protein